MKNFETLQELAALAGQASRADADVHKPGTATATATQATRCTIAIQGPER